MKNNIQFATLIRFIGVALILLCHYTEQSSSSLLNMSAQFFNIGVPIFIILSGFLFGVREGGKNALSWYFNRIKRIYIPYELFVVILAVITLLRGENIFTINWFLLVLGLQGSVVGIHGAEQTWECDQSCVSNIRQVLTRESRMVSPNLCPRPLSRYDHGADFMPAFFFRFLLHIILRYCP